MGLWIFYLGKVCFIIIKHLYLFDSIFEQELIQKLLNPHPFLIFLAYGNIFDFKYWDRYDSLLFSLLNNDCSSDEEIVAGNRLSIVNVFQIATVGIVYNCKRLILFSMANWIFSPYNPDNACFFEILKNLFTNAEVTYLEIRIVLNELSYNKNNIWLHLIA